MHLLSPGAPLSTFYLGITKAIRSWDETNKGHHLQYYHNKLHVLHDDCSKRFALLPAIIFAAKHSPHILLISTYYQ